MKFGHLTVEGHTELQRRLGKMVVVLLDGVDVTKRCIESNDVTGEVTLLCNDREHKSWQRREIGSHLQPGSTDMCLLNAQGEVSYVVSYAVATEVSR